MTPLAWFCCLYCQIWTYFTPCSSIIINFEHVIADWVTYSIYCLLILSSFRPCLFIHLSLCEKCPNTELFLVHIFLQSDWIRRDTLYLSAFSPNAGKYGPEKTPYFDTFHAMRLFYYFCLAEVLQDHVECIFANSVFLSHSRKIRNLSEFKRFISVHPKIIRKLKAFLWFQGE